MKRFILISVLTLVSVGSLLAWWAIRPAPPIPLGIVAWLGSGTVVGSSEINAADLFMEEHPESRIRVLPVDDEWNSERTASVIQDSIDKGVRFFVSTHPSKCAVVSLPLFANSQALLINTASTSPALSGRDDFFFRITPDAVQEQRAIAKFVNEMPGRRILVLQDISNTSYTDPAFTTFAAELEGFGKWRIVHHRLMITNFRPDEFRSLMAEPYDALYILAGTFQNAIGNIAQLFHYLQPTAPILLTPWARSPAILETAGDAIDQIILPSVYPSRQEDPRIDDYFRRFNMRFGYAPHAMTIGIRQALELFDQAFAKGYYTPEAMKKYLLSAREHQTSLGPIAFDQYGDVASTYYFIRNPRLELQ